MTANSGLQPKRQRRAGVLVGMCLTIFTAALVLGASWWAGTARVDRDIHFWLLAVTTAFTAITAVEFVLSSGASFLASRGKLTGDGESRQSEFARTLGWFAVTKLNCVVVLVASAWFVSSMRKGVPTAATAVGTANASQVDSFPPAVTAALIAGGIGVLGLWLTTRNNAATLLRADRGFEHDRREHEMSRDREFRKRVFRDFLVRESERSDAYAAYARLKRERGATVGKKDSSEELARLRALDGRIAEASDVIDERRARTWEAISAIQMLGDVEVLRTARQYDKRVSSNSPRRSSPVHLDYAMKRDLIFAFTSAARANLGLAAVTEGDMFWSEQTDLQTTAEDDGATAD